MTTEPRTPFEDRIARSLHAHADRIEPGDDAYLSLRRRIASSQRQGPGLGPRLVAVAAALIAVVGVGAVVAQQRSTTDVETLPSTIGPVGADAVDPDVEGTPSLDDGESASDPDPEDSSGSSASDATSATAADYPAIAPAPSGVFGPKAASVEEAARRFLELIQRDVGGVALEVRGAEVDVVVSVEGGPRRVATVLTVGSTPGSGGVDAFVVVEATSPDVIITAPAPSGRVTEPVLTVDGEGTGFEATLDVELFSADDGVSLARTSAMAGNLGELAPFKVDIPVGGTDWAWLVVSSATGADVAVTDMHAVPVRIEAPLPTTSYTVTALDPDDPDGGLVVRSRPGTDDGTELGSLPPGSVVHKRGRSSLVGTGDLATWWWNVWLPDAIDGRKAAWVSSAFLTRNGELDDGAMADLGRQVASALISDDPAAMAALPWSERRSVKVGWSGRLESITATELTEVATWTTIGSWSIPEERFAEPDREVSLFDHLDVLGSETDLEAVVEAFQIGSEPTAVSPFGIDQRVVATRFAGTHHVVVADPGADGSQWQSLAVFVEAGVDGPEIVGLVPVFWIP